MRKQWSRVLVLCIVMVLPGAGIAQSLTEKLSEEETFYRNYGKETYSKLKIEKDVTGQYDYFGEYITDGTRVYTLENETELLSSQREGVTDSMLIATSNEYQRSDFFEKFSNLVITQDAIGGSKMSFLIGDQITTRFTPLTFNKVNFNGIRWDVWSTGLQSSFLLSRTRPGFLAKKGESGSADVIYPLTEDVFDEKYYNNKRGGGFQGGGDYSNKSPFGEYDLLWAIHAQNTIANKVDVGLSYINHHVTDVKKGENFINVSIPEGWMPNEIHFEISDLTPQDKSDAGAYVHDVKMFVNDVPVRPRPEYAGEFRQVFVGSDIDSILLPRDLPIAKPQSGHSPVVVAFKTDPQYWYFGNSGTKSLASISQIKSIRFEYTVAGNYLVFVSTSKYIPLAIYGEKDPQTDEVEYEHPERTIEDLYEGRYDRPLKIDAVPKDRHIPEGYSTTYFGEYIRKSPKRLTISEGRFTQACRQENRHAELLADPQRARERYNFDTHSYTYGINISSVTYGLNVKGELGGVTFSGELALNQKEDKLPTRSGEGELVNRLAGTFKAQRPIGKEFGLNAEAYYIAPDWQTNLENLHPSRYFKETDYKDDSPRDYLSYPRPLGNGWEHVDDNDDNDPFVESDRRSYPSDFKNDQKGKFFADGTLKWGDVKPLQLPTGMLMPYDDPDGVIASKDDRNRNGVPDYEEDFLLFGSDPPVFELGLDLNNNGIPDYEDDDILPDFGHSVGYFITSDDIKTQGIRGLNLNLRWTPLDELTVDVGGSGESITDYDLSGVADLFENIGNDDIAITDNSRDFFEGKSFVGYANAKMEIIRRSQGILLELGNELRLIRDAIRNDAVKSTGIIEDADYVVTYQYVLDPLRYRRAAVDNLIGSIIYNNIPNFEYALRGKLGVQKRFELRDSVTVPYSFLDPLRDETIFATRREKYPDRTIGDFYAVNRVQYAINFNNEFEDWRRVFHPFNRLRIIPQYKFSYLMSKEFEGPTKNDPRMIEKHIRFDKNFDGEIDSLDNEGDNLQNVENARIESQQYRENNKMRLLSVPIMRMNYKIAENTQFEFGVQWLRDIDFISPEENKLKTTVLGQIVSKANYKGYNVTFFLGGRWRNFNYDVNAYDPVLLTGSRWDSQNWEFFAQIYSGS